jgi:hypothetical protein
MSGRLISSKIFISYRREDSAGYARLIYDRLDSRFPEQIFMDVSGIGLGADFADSLREAIKASAVLIALIGRSWLTSTGPNGQSRLQDPQDFVRTEIRTALERGCRVIPVLLPSASMPRIEDLPGDIAALAYRQALQLTDVDLDQNVAMLIQTLEMELGLSSEAEKSIVMRFARIALPLSAVAAAISDLVLPSTYLTPRLAFALAFAALLFAALIVAARHFASKRWPQLNRNRATILRVCVFFTAMTLMFGLLAVAQRLTHAESDKGIFATRIPALAKVRKLIFVSPGAQDKHTATDAGGYASSPSVMGMPSNAGWMISFQLPDQHSREILYRLNRESAFTSTGTSHREVDPITGLPAPNYSVTIPSLRGANVISLKYIDAQGQERGPFLLPFDTDKEYVKFTKDVLDSLPLWVSFREYPKGQLLVYFTNLVSYKNAFEEIRYSVDNDSLSQRVTFVPDRDSVAPGITDKDQIYQNIPMSTKFVYVKLIYIDHTESSIRKFASDLRAD